MRDTFVSLPSFRDSIAGLLLFFFASWRLRVRSWSLGSHPDQTDFVVSRAKGRSPCPVPRERCPAEFSRRPLPGGGTVRQVWKDGGFAPSSSSLRVLRVFVVKIFSDGASPDSQCAAGAGALQNAGAQGGRPLSRRRQADAPAEPALRRVATLLPSPSGSFCPAGLFLAASEALGNAASVGDGLASMASGPLKKKRAISFWRNFLLAGAVKRLTFTRVKSTGTDVLCQSIKNGKNL